MTTTTEVRQSVGRLPAGVQSLDPELTGRVALAYGLILYRLLPPRQLLDRLQDIGLPLFAATDFIRIVAEADLALSRKGVQP